VDPVSAKVIDPLTGQPVPPVTAPDVQIWGGARVLMPDGQAKGVDLFSAPLIPGFQASLIQAHLAQVPEAYRSSATARWCRSASLAPLWVPN